MMQLVVAYSEDTVHSFIAGPACGEHWKKFSQAAVMATCATHQEKQNGVQPGHSLLCSVYLEFREKQLNTSLPHKPGKKQRTSIFRIFSKQEIFTIL
jgi:hypothetical protein